MVGEKKQAEGRRFIISFGWIFSIGLIGWFVSQRS
jgi:hypothetical protein